MSLIIIVYLFILWTLFWSFSSVIIDRLKNKKNWIISWRSECPKCKHKLWFFDLIPIFSFILNKWKCRYCWKKISILYPLLEISTWILFAFVWYFLIDFNLILNGSYTEIYKLIFFLAFSFLSIVYIFYDILYLEIPDRIMLLLVIITFWSILLQNLIPNFSIFSTLPIYNWEISQSNNLIIVNFWIIVIISFYIIMLKWLKEIYDLAILALLIFIWLLIRFYLEIPLEETAIWSAIIASLLVFIFLFLQIFISWWAWLWWWDLRIWIILWLVSWINYWFYAILISYLSWSLIWLLIIWYSKIKLHYERKKTIIYKIKNILKIKQASIKIDSKMPFWPFLAIWIFSVIIYWNEIVNYIKDVL